MTLAGGLFATDEIIGDYGTGAFTQTGGTNTVSSALTLAQSTAAAAAPTTSRAAASRRPPST